MEVDLKNAQDQELLDEVEKRFDLYDDLLGIIPNTHLSDAFHARELQKPITENDVLDLCDEYDICVLGKDTTEELQKLAWVYKLKSKEEFVEECRKFLSDTLEIVL